MGCHMFGDPSMDFENLKATCEATKGLKVELLVAHLKIVKQGQNAITMSQRFTS